MTVKYNGVNILTKLQGDTDKLYKVSVKNESDHSAGFDPLTGTRILPETTVDFEITGDFAYKIFIENIKQINSFDKHDFLTVIVDGEKISVTGLSITPKTKNTVVGKAFKVNATIIPDDATNKEVLFTSDNEAVLTIDADGNVSAISAGKATITAKASDGDFTATTAVTVKDDEPVLVTSITLDPTDVKIKSGATQQLNATIVPDDAANKDVTFASSDVAIASVDEKGLVTALSVGEVEITVTAQDGSNTTANSKITIEASE